MRAVPEVTLGEIADFVGGTFSGARDRRVSGVAPLADANGSQISFLANPKYAPQLETTRAAAAAGSESAPRRIAIH